MFITYNNNSVCQYLEYSVFLSTIDPQVKDRKKKNRGKRAKRYKFKKRKFKKKWARNMKRCSGLLVFRAAHIKILTMFYFIHLRLSNILVWQHQMFVRLMGRPNLSYIVWTCVQPLWKALWCQAVKLVVYLSHDPALSHIFCALEKLVHVDTRRQVECSQKHCSCQQAQLERAQCL